MEYDWIEEFYRLAHRWEQQSMGLQEVRAYQLGDNSESIALLNRQKVFERCSEELRGAANRAKEILQTINQQTNGGAKPKSTKR